MKNENVLKNRKAGRIAVSVLCRMFYLQFCNSHSKIHTLPSISKYYSTREFVCQRFKTPFRFFYKKPLKKFSFHSPKRNRRIIPFPEIDVNFQLVRLSQRFRGGSRQNQRSTRFHDRYSQGFRLHKNPRLG